MRGIEPQTSWLVVRHVDHFQMRRSSGLQCTIEMENYRNLLQNYINGNRPQGTPIPYEI